MGCIAISKKHFTRSPGLNASEKEFRVFHFTRCGSTGLCAPSTAHVAGATYLMGAQGRVGPHNPCYPAIGETTHRLAPILGC